VVWSFFRRQIRRRPSPRRALSGAASWLFGFRRRHIIGAGTAASVIGLYSYGAQVGLLPYNPMVVVRALVGDSPVVQEAEKELTAATGVTLPPAASFSNSLGTNTAAYPANGYGASGYNAPAYGAGDITSHFSPNGGCTDTVVAEIRQARQQILVQAYSFTSAPIASALVEAHNRGVSVVVVLDKSQKSEQYSSADFVSRAGIPTRIDSAHQIAHNKIMLIDGQTIITGSFNFTKNAEENNAENLLVIRGRPDLYQAYENNFRAHYGHSQPYQSRGTGGTSPAPEPTHRGHSHPQPTPSYAPSYGPTNGPAYAPPSSYGQSSYGQSSSGGIIAYPR
jgi:phosphatidylserine/phosphatidylglycerophosphate/cardiolipin synthase-like enzyme